MRLGRSIYGTNGEVLLARGVLLNERFLRRLHELGIEMVYIYDERIGDIPEEEIIPEKTRLQAIQATKNVVESVQLAKRPDLSQVYQAVNSIIDDLLANRRLTISLIDIKSSGDEIFIHSVNVAVYSLIIGMALEYPYARLKDLGMGALLHDIGKVLVAQENNAKNNPYLHAEVGFDFLRRDPEISAIAAHVAWEHHENYDGSGGPRGIKENEIHEFARIVAVANSYDHMVSGHWGRVYYPQQVVEYLTVESGRYFDPQIVEIFVRHVASFPVGTTVQLNTGEIGVVIKNYPGLPLRPVVRVLNDRFGEEISPPYDVDLREDPRYFILKVLDYGV